MDQVKKNKAEKLYTLIFKCTLSNYMNNYMTCYLLHMILVKWKRWRSISFVWMVSLKHCFDQTCQLVTAVNECLWVQVTTLQSLSPVQCPNAINLAVRFLRMFSQGVCTTHVPGYHKKHIHEKVMQWSSLCLNYGFQRQSCIILTWSTHPCWKQSTQWIFPPYSIHMIEGPMYRPGASVLV